MSIQLLKWLEEKLPTAGKLPSEFSTIIPPLLSCLEDRSGDVRKKAQAALPHIMLHVGYDNMCKQCAKLGVSHVCLLLFVGFGFVFCCLLGFFIVVCWFCFLSEPVYNGHCMSKSPHNAAGHLSIFTGHLSIQLQWNLSIVTKVERLPTYPVTIMPHLYLLLCVRMFVLLICVYMFVCSKPPGRL